MPRLQICLESAPPKLEARQIADAINSVELPDNGILTVAVRFVPPSEMGHLNKRFKGGKGPTNVLTFVYVTCADIAVCQQIAVTDARIRGWDLFSELAYLCIHGCLHALGFDHEDLDSKKEMERVEGLILARMGIDALASGSCRG